VKSAKVGAREILSKMSDKEYLAHWALAGTMPRLNRVFEEFGIHHEEHDVPAKVHKSLEDKAKKATAKNATAAAEAKKRMGAGASKVVSKKQKTLTASAAFANDDDEVVENVDGVSSPIAARAGGECSIASLDLSGNDFIDTTLQGMGGGPTAKSFIVAPMPGVLGDDSFGSVGEGANDGATSRQKMRRPTT
jgi:hypothetical protein